MQIITANGPHIKEVIYLVTDAQGVPLIDRSKNACAVLESFLSEDAVCYRICGPIPHGRTPVKVEYFTRPAHQDEETDWEACDGDGCLGERMQFQADTATLCGQLRIWKGDGVHRDLMVKVTLVNH